MLSISLALLGLGVALGCDGDQPQPQADAAVAADATGDALPAHDTNPGVIQGLVTSTDACCLAMGADEILWAEGGDLFAIRFGTQERRAVAEHPAVQKDPVLHDGLLVWADDRGGDFDLWAMAWPDGEPYLLVGGPGDQDQPTLHGGRVAWVGRVAAPHAAHNAEIWVMELGDPSSARALTDDVFEQTQPHLHGDRVVWADFRASLTGAYIDLSDPASNNSDIYGFDLAAGEELVVTVDPSKQLRPAIEGDDVVWLDWRGINPEPKYSEFQVFTRRLGDPVERRLAWSAWTQPELWQRPAIDQGVVAWVAEPGPGHGFVTGVFATRLDGGEPWVVTSSSVVLEAVVLGDARAAWLGGGTLGFSLIERTR